MKSGADIRLRPRSFDVLRYLVERQGILVTRDELLAAFWGQTVVTEDAVAHCLSDIRAAIQDPAHEVIRTIPRRGYILDVPVTKPGDPATTATARSQARVAPRRLGTVALALLLGILAAWWWTGDRGVDEGVSTESRATVPMHSIAVLPFLDMSPEQDQAYLADGIAEEILNLLAQIPELRVISRSSSFSFKGKSIETPAVARQLNVNYVLEGSVRRAGTQLRVSAQLIEASSDTHLWSDTYDRRLDNIFQIQDDIAASVVDALRIELLGDAPRSREISQDIYSLVLQARFFWNRKAPGDEQRAKQYYQRALAIDAGYAPAWAGLSATYLADIIYGRTTHDIGFAEAREAAEMALSLDPDLADAHARLGILHAIDHDRESAIARYRHALALDPNNPLALAAMATVWWEGRLDDAVSWYAKAAAVDPLTTTWPNNMAHLLIKAGRLDDAEAAARKAMILSPDAPGPGRNLAIVHILRGQFDVALELALALPEHAEKTLVLTIIYNALGRQRDSDAALNRLISAAGIENPFLIAQAYACRGEIDEAFTWLEKANDAHRSLYGLNEASAQFEFDPFLENLRDDPRWDTLLGKLEPLP